MSFTFSGPILIPLYICSISCQNWIIHGYIYHDNYKNVQPHLLLYTITNLVYSPSPIQTNPQTTDSPPLDPPINHVEFCVTKALLGAAQLPIWSEATNIHSALPSPTHSPPKTASSRGGSPPTSQSTDLQSGLLP